MTLEDLIIRHYRVERFGDRMIAIEDQNGAYRAKSAELVEGALTDTYPPRGVEVKIGNKWHYIKRHRRGGQE